MHPCTLKSADQYRCVSNKMTAIKQVLFLLIMLIMSPTSEQKDSKKRDRELNVLNKLDGLFGGKTKSKYNASLPSTNFNSNQSTCNCKLMTCRERVPPPPPTFVYGVKKPSHSITLETNDKMINETEMLLIQKFRQRIQPLIPSSSLVFNFTNDDSYVLRWLRGYSLDINKTVEYFLEHIEFRKALHLDFINTDEYWTLFHPYKMQDLETDDIDDDEEEEEEENYADWSEFEKGFPMRFDAFDRKGRPFVEIHFWEWNIRRAVYKSIGEMLVRWWMHMLEMQTRILNLIEAPNSGYKQSVIIFDLEKILTPTHECPSCYSFYYEIMFYMEAYYPDLFAHIIFINASPVFESILRVFNRALKKETFSRIEVYGEREGWLERVNDLIAADQRTARFHGTKRKTE